MGEGIGFNPDAVGKPTPTETAVQLAQRETGLSLSQIAVSLHLDEGDTSLLLEAATRIPQEDALAAAVSGAVHEARTNDEYVLPTVNELLNGGGNYWRPLFSAQRAEGVRADDDVQAMAERGFVHMLTEREPLNRLLENLPQGEQTNYKALSTRILEMRIRRNMIERAIATDDTALAERLTTGVNLEELLQQGEQFGLLKPARQGGRIASDADDLRAEYKGRPAAYGIAATMLQMESRLGSLLVKPPTPIKPDTFLPHISPNYASAFGHYCAAKLTAPPAAPVL